MQIMEGQPELDLSNPQDQETLAKAMEAPPKEEPKAEAKETKETKSTIETPKQDLEGDLEKQVKGLKAELARRQGQSDRVHELEQELERSKAEWAASRAKSAADPVIEAIQELNDKDLIGKQTDWEDELAAARAKYERADENGNTDAMRDANTRIGNAKRILSLLREEATNRTDRKAQARTAQQQEVTQLESELEAMRGAVTDAFPDFEDKESELWKAGNEQFNAHPALMARMGAAGEVVAAAMAILKNPALVKGTSAAARKEVINKIDKGLGKALQGGAVSPSGERTIDYSRAVDSAEGLGKFNDMIEKLKAGGRA